MYIVLGFYRATFFLNKNNKSPDTDINAIREEFQVFDIYGYVWNTTNYITEVGLS